MPAYGRARSSATRSLAIDGKSVTDGAALAAAVRTFEPGHPTRSTSCATATDVAVDVPTGESRRTSHAGSGARLRGAGRKGADG